MPIHEDNIKINQLINFKKSNVENSKIELPKKQPRLNRLNYQML